MWHEVDTLGARATVELRPGGSFQQVRPWPAVALLVGRGGKMWHELGKGTPFTTASSK